MSASSIQKDVSFGDWTIQDPGDAAAISKDITGTCRLTTGSDGETRTIALPVRAGTLITLNMETDGGGDCVVTVAGGADEAGNTTITFSDTGEYCTLRSVLTDTDTYGWRVADFDGVTGITIGIPTVTYADNTDLVFGTGSDFTVDFNETNLQVLPKTDDTGALYVGNGTADCDFKVFMGTTGEYFQCDMGASRVTVASAEAVAFSVGRLGATTPAFQVDASTATSITGLKVKSAGTGAGVAVSALGGTNEALTIDGKGSGAITLAGTSTGAVTVGAQLLVANGKTAFIGTSAAPGTTAGTNWLGLNGAGTAPVGTVSNGCIVYAESAGDDLDVLHADGTTDNLLT